jgi:hypothetical protein
MIKKINIPVFIALAMLLGFCLQAQEQLMPLSVNPQLFSVPAKNLQASRTTSLSALDTIPFFEDFSYSTTSPYPSVNHWLDSSVFINHTFPIAPPSIGVATFDGLNKKGYPYNLSALVSNSAQADILTSRPINLQKHLITYQPSDSIYLSFYYQAEGRGDNPEAGDSLSLDFYKPNQKKWEKVWGVKGYNPSGADSLFHLVIIPIKDTACFDSLFQFRFRNRATLSGSLDHWHVDYIYIDRLRTYGDPPAQDVAFQYMSTSFLKNYSTMPYRQYISSEMAPKVYNYIRNNHTVSIPATYNYTIYDTNNAFVSTGTTGPSGNVGAGDVDPYSQVGTDTVRGHARIRLLANDVFPPLTGMSIYSIVHKLKLTTDPHPQNDSIIQIQRFSDYYAYDDGTAEAGYYNNTYGAKNAVRYTLNAPDTLRALRIYFDPITDGQNIINSTFNIMVWRGNDGINGAPGSLLYSDSTNHESNPVYLQGRHNIMPTFPLSSCLTLSPGTYYFGIKQKTNRPLNIGFDRNNNHSDALYYDIGGGWVQSSIKGSIMINPLLGCALDPLPVGVKKHSGEGSSSFNLYPNPAQDNFKIETNGVIPENATINILSSIGQTVQSTTYNSNESIDISSLPNGIYFIYLSSSELNATPKKLIISR